LLKIVHILTKDVLKVFIKMNITAEHQVVQTTSVNLSNYFYIHHLYFQYKCIAII